MRLELLAVEYVVIRVSICKISDTDTFFYSNKSAVTANAERNLSAPFTSAATAPFPISTCEWLPGKLRTRFRESQSHAGILRLRNTPLLSSTRRFKELENTYERLSLLHQSLSSRSRSRSRRSSSWRSHPRKLL